MPTLKYKNPNVHILRQTLGLNEGAPKSQTRPLMVSGWRGCYQNGSDGMS